MTALLEPTVSAKELQEIVDTIVNGSNGRVRVVERSDEQYLFLDGRQLGDISIQEYQRRLTIQYAVDVLTLFFAKVLAPLIQYFPDAYQTATNALQNIGLRCITGERKRNAWKDLVS